MDMRGGWGRAGESACGYAGGVDMQGIGACGYAEVWTCGYARWVWTCRGLVHVDAVCSNVMMCPLCDLQVKEKEIATQLKWNLNAVTSLDFIEELSQRLHPLLHTQEMLDKLSKHSLALANICLLCK